MRTAETVMLELIRERMRELYNLIQTTTNKDTAKLHEDKYIELYILRSRFVCGMNLTNRDVKLLGETINIYGSEYGRKTQFFLTQNSYHTYEEIFG